MLNNVLPRQIGINNTNKTVTCSFCDSIIIIRNYKNSVTFFCESCRSEHSIDDIFEAKITQKLKDYETKISKNEQIISLGQKGIIKEIEWEVIGYIEKIDCNEIWSEYLLFNETEGYSWLSEFEGHWNFIQVCTESPKVSSQQGFNKIKAKANYLGASYSLFHKGTSTVKYAVGEFFWPLKIGETVYYETFISPPKSITFEKFDQEFIWSIAEYIKFSEIKKAFKIQSKRFSFQFDVYSNQPFVFEKSLKQISKIWIIFFIILSLIQLIYFISAKNTLVLSSHYSLNTVESENVITTQPFELKDNDTNLEINLLTQLENNWIEIQGALINIENGKAWDFSKVIEYYSGYDSDGSWTEGQKNESVIFNQVPSGKYHLVFDSVSSENLPINYSIEIKRDVPTWINYFLAILFLSFIPLFFLLLRFRFERARWSRSNFSPYS